MERQEEQHLLRSDCAIGKAAEGKIFSQRYKVIEAAGSGGLSDVYRAIDLGSGKEVALKVLRIAASSYATGLELFTSDARLSCKHPNLVSVYCCGVSADDEPWLAMEWLQGEPLTCFLERQGKLSFDQSMRLLEQLAVVLDYLHSKGEVHSNLKPSSIVLLNREGQFFVKLSDFGFAKILIERELEMADERAPARGSPLYMSPEQFRGKRIDSRADVYAVGCIMFECLLGSPPFRGVDLLETMDKHMHGQLEFARDCGLSEPIKAVLLKMLDKDPALRQRTVGQSLQEFKVALLGRFPEPEPLPVSRSSTREVQTVLKISRSPKGREPWLLLMTCVTVLLFLLIFQQCMNMVREFNSQSAEGQHQDQSDWP